MPRISNFRGTNFMNRQAPYGFGIRFSVNEDKSVFADIIFDETKEGGKDILHGGAIAAVLDEAMGTAAYEAGSAGYTATMSYTYLAHIPLYQEIHIRAWIEKIDGKKIYAVCDATLPDSRVAVTGTGLFIYSESLQKLLDDYPYYPKNDQNCNIIGL